VAMIKRLSVDIRCAMPNGIFTIEDLAWETGALRFLVVAADSRVFFCLIACACVRAETVYCRWRARGVLVNALWDIPPTGKEIDFSGTAFSFFFALRPAVLLVLSY
jgi:hypothetical protein